MGCGSSKGAQVKEEEKIMEVIYRDRTNQVDPEEIEANQMEPEPLEIMQQEDDKIIPPKKSKFRVNEDSSTQPDSTNITQSNQLTSPQLFNRLYVSNEEIENQINQMINDYSCLSNGFEILSQYEKASNFYISLLKLGFTTRNDKIKKLSLSSFLTFLKANYTKDQSISNEERLSIVALILENLTTEDYYLKNFIASALGFIAAKEFPNCYEGFIKYLLKNLLSSCTEDENQTDTILKIFIEVLKTCNDTCAIITPDVLPVILNVFKISKRNQKNREKCLIIISLLLSKLSYADGNDSELLSKSLDTNNLMENGISLFTTILVSNPKMLLDIKKMTIRILDILVRDMTIYSSKFFNMLINPSWRLLVLESSLYGDTVIFNKEIEYTQNEEITMEDENHIYERGYESDDDEEKHGMEGLILELIDFSVDLLKRSSVIETLRPVLYTFLLCIKGYLLMPHNSITLWKNDPNLYISEEYDEENINSVRSKTLGLIREITKEIEDQALGQFIQLIIFELKERIDIENYKEVIKLDDYNLIIPYLEKLNSVPLYIQTRRESNLLILGTLSDDLLRLKEKMIISNDEINQLIQFLIKLISSPPQSNSSILIGRAIWCISKLLCLVRHDVTILKEIFNSISLALCNSNSDLSVKLVASQCLSILCQRLIASKKPFDSEHIFNVYDRLISLLDKVNEETLFIPVENILYLSKLNKQKGLYIPLNHLSPLLKVYSSYFNDSFLGGKLLELIKIWCEDKASANALMSKFIPIAIKGFEEFYRNIGDTSVNFEMVKKTVMTEHSNPDIKTSVNMIPNLIDIITMLTKYCSETKDEVNLKWISLIVNALSDILIKSTDVTILQRGSSFLRFYIALCKETILKEHQVDMLLKVINRYFDPNLLESSMLYIGNVISQFFFHIENKIIPSLLEVIVNRIYRAKMPSIVQSVILVYSRFLTKFPIDTLNFLISIQVENRVGLKILIDKWLLHQPLFRGKYFKNVSIKALANLYQMKNNILESLMVIGYNPSHSTASVEVNAPCKILSVLIRCLNNELMQEKIKNEKTNYDNLNKDDDDSDEYDDFGRREEADDDDNDEENEMNDKTSFEFEDNKTNSKDNDEDKKLDINEDEFKNIIEEPRDFSSKLQFLNNQGKTGGLNNLEQGSEIYLTEMLGFDYNDIEGEDEENTEDDLVYLTDLDFNFELKNFLIDWFKTFSKQDEEYLTECLKLLPKEDQKMYKNLNLNIDEQID